ncbi:hypothetical protein KRR38_34410 [Novosphingobium sp. G106]|uniref:hypothetical protein n=1 Tax=Novosphingobium sp. G106 TaxID=2849500 RepID=UPI001C2CD750|nr:hypothetical protein [Novosphingobium sp. G106]MBV1692590.1 hypothetical protein [Novosphingobium sp. G106]
MTKTSLEVCVAAISRDWKSVGAQVIANCCRHMAVLSETDSTETWLAEINRANPASQELYRDPDNGFVLQTHVEQQGVYRSPHDYGRSWVIYAVQHGEVEMGTYARIGGPGRGSQLVKRSSTVLQPSMAHIYLPGDIHDTLCLQGPAVLFRFTERDLKDEASAGLMTRYALRNGMWMAAA